MSPHGRREHPSRGASVRGRVAVVGAGVSGLTCAGALAGRGAEVVVFDKGGRPGGRLATRRAADWSCDHGAQYFTARDAVFARAVERWRELGLVAEWRGRFVSIEGGTRRASSERTRRFVGVPEMNAVAAHLARDLDIRERVLVDSVERIDGRWHVGHDRGEDAPFDALVVAVPAPQAIPLLDASPRLSELASRVRMRGCWAVMIAFDERLDVPFDGAFVNEGPLSWVARNGSKPGRTAETWVLHAGPAWTGQHIEDAPDDVGPLLVEAFARLVEPCVPRPREMQVHRWRYALPEEPLETPCIVDASLELAACGDWCGGPRVEGAYCSGLAAAESLADVLGAGPDGSARDR